VLVLCGSGCASVRTVDGQPATKAVDERDFHCARAIMDGASPYRMPLAGREPDPSLAATLSDIPYKARRAALAAGLEPLLSRLLVARAAAPSGGSIEVLTLEEELTLRLVAFHAQLSAAAFEAGCTADMIQKLLPEFAHREQTRQLTITVASLVVGAIASVAAGTWSLTDNSSRGPAVLGIAGGAATTGLGVAALTHKDRSIRFEHSRNRLAPLWRGTDPDHLYPSFVFHMLTYPDASDGRSPRDDLLAAWRLQLEQSTPAAEQGAARERLLSEGGTYDESLLTLRAEMFESLESAIQGLARDLELLNRWLVHSLTSPVPMAGRLLP
jgi:hypothetical protein